MKLIKKDNSDKIVVSIEFLNPITNYSSIIAKFFFSMWIFLIVTSLQGCGKKPSPNSFEDPVIPEEVIEDQRPDRGDDTPNHDSTPQPSNPVRNPNKQVIPWDQRDQYLPNDDENDYETQDRRYDGDNRNHRKDMDRDRDRDRDRDFRRNNPVNDDHQEIIRELPYPREDQYTQHGLACENSQNHYFLEHGKYYYLDSYTTSAVANYNKNQNSFSFVSTIFHQQLHLIDRTLISKVMIGGKWYTSSGYRYTNTYGLVQFNSKNSGILSQHFTKISIEDLPFGINYKTASGRNLNGSFNTKLFLDQYRACFGQFVDGQDHLYKNGRIFLILPEISQVSKYSLH